MSAELWSLLLGPGDHAPLVRALEASGASPQVVARLALAARYAGALDDPEALAARLRHVGPEAAASARAEHGARASVVLAARDVWLHELVSLDDGEVLAAIAGDTELAAAAIEALRDPAEHAAARVTAALPLVAALATPAAPPVEHDPPPAGVTARPLIDHVAVRALGRKLAALERRDAARFGVGPGAAAFAAACASVEAVRDAGLLPAVRLALLHLDVAKGGDAATRAAWEAAGVDLTIHNLASARLFERWVASGARVPDPALVTALIEGHGLAGQSLRGETPRPAFARLLARIAALRAPLAARLGVDEARAAAVIAECLHVINVCDTAAVREGLVDDALLAGLEGVREWLAGQGARATGDAAAIEAALAAAATPREPAVERLALAERLARLRAGRLRAGEPRAETEAAIAGLDDATVLALGRALAGCQLWYCEAATAALSPGAQLRVLAAAAGAARRAGVDVTRSWHAQLQPLIARLGGDAPHARYRVRLAEAILGPLDVGQLLDGGDGLQLLGTVEARLGGDAAVVVELKDSDEASALLTLLSIYERKSSAAFHATLKALCDLYGLRKDDFDRLHNEAAYLATMNAARSDKARMLDFVRPGRIVEVGPGGGVVLDLLEDRFGDSEVIGIDVSQEVVAALAARRSRDRRRWRVIEADAFALPTHVGVGTVDTVIFCSVLHEIYSYVAHEGARYRLEPVRALIRAAYRALAPGGRIVIRDGVAPPHGTRRLAFVAPDARPTFDLFVAQFEGFRVQYRDLPDGRVELPSHHAMEFLYTYTWGPDSFPYEVREQYGILTYEAYGAALLDWLRDLADAGGAPRLVALPAAFASYLQPGYVDALAGKIVLTDELDRPVPLPDSNCLLVVERPG